MTAVVTDAMVHRARVVLRLHAPYDLPEHALKAAIEAALTDPRMCKGCTASLADMRKDAEWCSRACKIRTDRRLAAEQAAQTTNPVARRPGGLQVAFGPAVNHVSKYLSDATPLSPREARKVAERVLTHALSTRQRARARQLRNAQRGV